MFYIDTSVDILFLIDIFVNFNTGLTLPDGKIDYNRKRVTLSYLKSWFIIDCGASVPMNLITKFTINDDTNLSG